MRPEEQIRLWRGELIDLTRRNKLITLHSATGPESVELTVRNRPRRTK